MILTGFIYLLIGIILCFLQVFIWGAILIFVGCIFLLVIISSQKIRPRTGIYENGIIVYDEIYTWSKFHSFEVKEKSVKLYTKKAAQIDYEENEDLVNVLEKSGVIQNIG